MRGTLPVSNYVALELTGSFLQPCDCYLLLVRFFLVILFSPGHARDTFLLNIRIPPP
jgi:hypothetical protein